MSDHIDFYFDIISPYSYIAYKKLIKNKNVIFKYKPIFLGGLHNLDGINSQAFNKYRSFRKLEKQRIEGQKVAQLIDAKNQGDGPIKERIDKAIKGDKKEQKRL